MTPPGQHLRRSLVFQAAAVVRPARVEAGAIPVAESLDGQLVLVQETDGGLVHTLNEGATLVPFVDAGGQNRLPRNRSFVT